MYERWDNRMRIDCPIFRSVLIASVEVENLTKPLDLLLVEHKTYFRGSDGSPGMVKKKH